MRFGWIVGALIFLCSSNSIRIQLARDHLLKAHRNGHDILKQESCASMSAFISQSKTTRTIWNNTQILPTNRWSQDIGHFDSRNSLILPSMTAQTQSRQRNNTNNDYSKDKQTINFSSASLSAASVLSLTTKQTRKLYFVHVGKTGGETIRRILKRACYLRMNPQSLSHCWNDFTERHNGKESQLSKQTIGAMHCNVHQPAPIMANSWLWSVRHPLERVVSWFDYMNPTNCHRDNVAACVTNKSQSGWAYDFYKVCFATMDDFAMALTGKTTTLMQPFPSASQPMDPTMTTKTMTKHSLLTTAENCTMVARKGIRGRSTWKESSHLHFNYQYYASRTIHKYVGHEIFVVRTEQLWHDLQRIEKLLGGDPRSITADEYQDRITHGSHAFAKKSKLSNKETVRILCCFLQREIVIYIQLIRQARNLDFASREMTWTHMILVSGYRGHFDEL